MFMDDARGAEAVAVEGLVKRYPHRVAVEGLRLTLRRGDVVALVGGNGSGKTTTLRILAGILSPDAGRGHVLGFDLVREAAEIRRHVGYMPQRLALYGRLSVFENLRFRAQIYGLARAAAAADRAIEEFELGAHRRIAAGKLSGGWARRLQLAASLIHAPRLLLLDEPTAGLDVATRQDVWHRLGRKGAAGTTIAVSTHDLAEAERCPRAVLLSEGRVVAAGTPHELAQRAPAVAVLLSGVDAHRVSPTLDAVPGVIATHPEGSGLRVIAEAPSEERLRAFAASAGMQVARISMQLSDAALVLARESARARQ
jgi:ABC-2 type transport system ATP-binding protein